MIEKITHQPYEAFVRQAILRPAGITAMRIGKGHGPLPGEVSYSSLGSTRAFDLNIERMDSHGGWIASAEDLVRFARMVDGFSSPSLLKSSTIAQMVTPSHANKSYAHGWVVNEAGNWWHVGSLPGTTSIMVRTKSRFCWAALINVGGPQAKLDGALDDFCWSMVRKVRSWDA